MTKTDAHQPPRAALVTLGCPMNQVDSERIVGGLVSRGFIMAPEEEADLVVVNTCGFIESAREESVETILGLAGLKTEGQLRALVVVGCLAERYADDIARNLPEVDAVIGLSGSADIPDRCCELLGWHPEGEPTIARAIIGYPSTAYLKIAEGCDNRCAYCVIPDIRGPFRSIPRETVLAEAAELASLGIRELVLIGQDTTRWGSDLGGADCAGGLASLLGDLASVKDIAWLRLMYAHPAHMTDEIINALADVPAVTPYLDLPIQHIADSVLAGMGRKVTGDHIRRTIDRLRERVPGIVLRTTVMTGFPGETESDFDELLRFVEETRFERLGAFAWSPEEGTRAESLPDRVPDDVAIERYETIMETQTAISAAFNEGLIGQEFVLIADESDAESGTILGRTAMSAPEVDGTVSAVGTVDPAAAFYRVRITGADTYDLSADVLGAVTSSEAAQR